MTQTPDLVAVNALLDFITERLSQSERLFASSAEHARVFHGEAASAAKAWARSDDCMFPGCTARSIAASHSLQRAGPITALLEDHHVCTPKSYKGVLSVVRVGASEASTFPGFCDVHERLFEAFERRKAIQTDGELNLQIFRTLSREIRRKTFDLDRLDRLVTDLKARLNADVAQEAARLKVPLSSFSYEGTNLDGAEAYLAEGRQVLADLHALHAAHWPAVAGTGATGLEGDAFQVNLAFPVALSGMASVTVQGTPRLWLMGVIPQAQGTLIFLVGGPGSQAGIDSFLAHKDQDLPLIDIVERLMVRGTDHWFLRPSVWDALSPARQRALLALMADADSGMGDAVPLSIFDTMRRTALAAPMADPPAPDMADYAAAQQAKLTAV